MDFHDFHIWEKGWEKHLVLLVWSSATFVKLHFLCLLLAIILWNISKKPCNSFDDFSYRNIPLQSRFYDWEWFRSFLLSNWERIQWNYFNRKLYFRDHFWVSYWLRETFGLSRRYVVLSDNMKLCAVVVRCCLHRLCFDWSFLDELVLSFMILQILTSEASIKL